MQIKKSAIEKIRSNNKVVAKLMIAFDKGERTIQFWIENNDVRLTTVTALDIIKSETGMSDSEILEKEVTQSI